MAKMVNALVSKTNDYFLKGSSPFNFILLLSLNFVEKEGFEPSFTIAKLTFQISTFNPVQKIV